jgi:hypothetical protein
LIFRTRAGQDIVAHPGAVEKAPEFLDTPSLQYPQCFLRDIFHSFRLSSCPSGNGPNQGANGKGQLAKDN